MATQPYPVGHTEGARLALSPTRPAELARLTVAAGRRAAARREARPRLAYIGIPLAMISALLTAPIVFVGLVLLGWWYAPRQRGWEWLVVAGRALVGMEWALLGINLLADFRDQTVAVGLIWIYAALLLAIVSELLKRRRVR